jgi:hypothetical protein
MRETNDAATIIHADEASSRSATPAVDFAKPRLHQLHDGRAREREIASCSIVWELIANGDRDERRG